MAEDIFTQLSIFQGLTPKQLDQLRPVFYPCNFYTDTIIFNQGDPAEALYIVVSGEIVVDFKPDDGPLITVATVHPGSIVGWSAALGSRRYTSSAITTTYSQLLRLSGCDLKQLCKEYPETGRIFLDHLALAVADRLKNTHPQILHLLEMGLQLAPQPEEVEYEKNREQPVRPG